MNNKEAVEIIRVIRKQYIPRTVYDGVNEALTLAIKALEAQERCKELADVTDIDNAPTIERPQGEWYENEDGTCTCSNCYRISEADWDFCHNCGAKMKEGEE